MGSRILGEKPSCTLSGHLCEDSKDCTQRGYLSGHPCGDSKGCSCGKNKSDVIIQEWLSRFGLAPRGFVGDSGVERIFPNY